MLRVLFFCFAITATAQKELVLKKGIIIDSVKLSNSTSESYSLYLPKKYDTSKKWPIIFVVDQQGNGAGVLSYFKKDAEEQGYILAASNNTRDSLSTSQNILVFNRMHEVMLSFFSIDKNRVYTAGFSKGARLASAIPVFIKNIKGVISCGAGIHNIEFANNQKNLYHFIGIVGKEDYKYPEMLKLNRSLNLLKFPNKLLAFNGGEAWPSEIYIKEALQILNLSSMAKGFVPKDSIYIQNAYNKDIRQLKALKEAYKLLDLENAINKAIAIYKPHLSVDSLVNERKALQKQKLYKELKRNRRATFFNENLLKEEYLYAIEEDIETYNFNNLGWWNYQVGKINERITNKNLATQQMGKRLLGYVNALTNETIKSIEAEKQLDQQALDFLWMLKTIVSHKEYSNYLKIIASSAKNEDFETALFYLEELLKNGFTDKTKLYGIEHTSLLKITPEYNTIVSKYLKEARYEVIGE